MLSTAHDRFAPTSPFLLTKTGNSTIEHGRHFGQLGGEGIYNAEQMPRHTPYIGVSCDLANQRASALDHKRLLAIIPRRRICRRRGRSGKDGTAVEDDSRDR